MPVKHLCASFFFLFFFIPAHVVTSVDGHVVGPYPVHDEDLADVEFVLKLLCSDSHRVEEAEAPVDKQTGRKAGTCCYVDIFASLISQMHHGNPWNLGDILVVSWFMWRLLIQGHDESED